MYVKNRPSVRRCKINVRLRSSQLDWYRKSLLIVNRLTRESREFEDQEIFID